MNRVLIHLSSELIVFGVKGSLTILPRVLSFSFILSVLVECIDDLVSQIIDQVGDGSDVFLIAKVLGEVKEGMDHSTEIGSLFELLLDHFN